MKVFLATQRYYERGGPRLGTDRLVGIVVATDESSARLAVPHEAVCDWVGMMPVEIRMCGEIDLAQPVPFFVKASL